MNCQPKSFTVEEIVDAWKDTSLKANSEYQRGAAWKGYQQQALIDSIFRQYPIPPLFLHEITATGLGGHTSVRHEIVDGQQRIRALADFLADKYPLLGPEDKKLRLPTSLGAAPAPWGKRRFSELDAANQDKLKKRKLDVFLITGITHEDEIRDLFIRLQSGTALSRQQIRDAWPANVAPYIERLAGKMDKTPAIELFMLADRRGARAEDERDQHELSRQFCAQLLCLFLARESDPCIAQSIGANELDKLYHENTQLDSSGACTQRFEMVLRHTTKVCSAALLMEVEGPRGRRKKFTKLNLISTFLFIQDLSRNPLFTINRHFHEKVAPHLCATNLVINAAKSTSGPKIVEHYRLWRERMDKDVGIRLDPKRAFDEDQKREVYGKAEGKCAICGELVEAGHGEYDHFPVAYRDGGKTLTENCRLVHREHHPRGRPIAEEE
jgi:hypothetical protein